MALALFAHAVTVFTASPLRPMVHTPLGDIVGVSDWKNDVDMFLGIQYARPMQRFEAAVPVSKP